MVRWLAYFGWIGSAVLTSACRSAAADPYPNHTEAVLAIAGFRPFFPRLSGAIGYRTCPAGRAPQSPLPTVTCSDRPEPAVLRRAAEAAARIRSRLAVRPTIDSRWAAAVLDLALDGAGGHGSRDAIITRLREIRDLDPSNPGVTNDLAVAHLARMGEERRADDLSEALTLAAAAISLDSNSAVPWFTLAAVLETFHFTHQAEAAWRRAASLDRDASWSAEADGRRRAMGSLNARPDERQRLIAAADAGTLSDSLAAQAAEIDAETVRQVVLGDLLTRWARQVDQAGPAAGRTLRMAAAAARGVASATGDSIPSWVVAAVVATSGARTETSRIAKGILEADSGRRLFDDGRYADAAILYQAAVGRFAPTTSGPIPPAERRGLEVARSWFGLQLGLIAIYRGRFETADSIHTSIGATGAGPGAGSLAGLADWGLGMSWGRRGDVGRALAAFETAVPKLAAAGDRIAVGVLRTALADGYELRGLFGQSLLSGVEGQAALGQARRSRAAQVALINFGQPLERMGATAAALFAQREAVTIAELIGDAGDRTEGYSRLAQLLAKTGATVEARIAVDSARSARSRVTDPYMGPRLSAEIDEGEAALALPRDPARARALSDTAARYYQRVRLRAKLPPILATRGRARIAIGDTAGAIADLTASADLSQSLVGEGGAPGARRFGGSGRGEAFRTLVRLALQAGDSAGAFRLAMGGGRRTPGRRSLSSPAILGLTVLDDRVLQWVERNGRRVVRETRLARSELVRAIAAFRSDLAADRPSESASGDALYRILIGPAGSDLVGVARLVIVPDPLLATIPWAALRDPGTHRYLAEDMAVELATAWRDDFPESAASAGRADVVLLDASRFDRRLFPELAPLRFADSEIAAVRAAYPAGRAVVRPADSKDGALREIGAHSVVHIVGHARSMDGRPGLSHLILGAAGRGITESVLSEADLGRLDLRRVDLVVLSSCGTIGGSDGIEGPGGGGLPRALLAAGARAVISSSWEVDDEATAELMRRFHEEAGRYDPARALQRAQTWMLHHPNRRFRAPRHWGLFRVER